MRNQNNKEFFELYDPIHDQFSRFCRAISGNVEDSEDLMQDTVLNVFEGFDKIKKKTSFKPYLFSVACNLQKMKQRRSKFRASFSAEETEQIIDISQNPEYLTDFKIVYNKIFSLPVRMAETLILFYISDLSIEEICGIQGGSISGVKSRLKRGRKKLLSLLNTKEQIKVAHILLTF